MSAIALVGSVTLVLKESTLQRILLPLVAFSAGSLILIGDGLHNFLGRLVTYFFSFAYNRDWLIPFAAGNFLYIGAPDLVPEVNRHAESSSNFISFAALTSGLVLLLGVKLLLG